MKYLILNTASIDYAKDVSSAMWKLATPNATSGTTQYAVGWTVHPTTGEVALSLGNYEQRVDTNADIDAYVNTLPIPQLEKDELHNKLNNVKGSTIIVADMLPPSLKTNLKTQTEMQESGWFSQEQM